MQKLYKICFSLNEKMNNIVCNSNNYFFDFGFIFLVFILLYLKLFFFV